MMSHGPSNFQSSPDFLEKFLEDPPKATIFTEEMITLGPQIRKKWPDLD